MTEKFTASNGTTIETYSNDVVGHLRPHGDGWIGFYPKAIEQRDNRIVGGAE